MPGCLNNKSIITRELEGGNTFITICAAGFGGGMEIIMRISIIGIDGSGKSTQVSLLFDKLNSKEKYVIYKAKPQNRQIIESIEFENYKTYKKILSLGMSLDFIKEYQKSEKEKNVIWDRYKYCVISYFLAENIDVEFAVLLLSKIPDPDIIIWLDLSSEEAVKRIKLRGTPKLLENVSFLEKVRKYYKILLEGKNNVVKIACDCLTEQEVHDAIYQILLERGLQ